LAPLPKHVVLQVKVNVISFCACVSACECVHLSFCLGQCVCDTQLTLATYLSSD